MSNTPASALRLGTRRSKLAMAQSGIVADQVRQLTGRPVELVEITTAGDTSQATNEPPTSSAGAPRP